MAHYSRNLLNFVQKLGKINVFEISKTRGSKLVKLEVLHLRRGAQYVNVKGYSAAPDFLAIFAPALKNQSNCIIFG